MSKNYLDPKDLLKEILKSKEQDELTPKAVEYFMLMASEISKTLSYKYEEDREDCIMFAMESILKYWRSYDPEKSKYPFSYFTSAIYNGLAKGWGQLHPIKESYKISISHENTYNFD